MTIKDYPELMELMARALDDADSHPRKNLGGALKYPASLRTIRAVSVLLTAMQAAGVVPVPVEATKEMKSAGRSAIPAKTIEDMDHRAGVCINAAIAASPLRRKE